LANLIDFDFYLKFGFSKNDQLPIVRWERNNNATHGVLKAYVDLTKSRKPIEVKLFFARTFDKKRRDFRLVIADPNDPSKVIPHPGIFKINYIDFFLLNFNYLFFSSLANR
jgi:hypothetical protein